VIGSEVCAVSTAPLRTLISESQNGLSKRAGDQGDELPVLRLADISGGAIDESAPRAIRLTEKERAKYELHRGDLLCIRVNGSKALVGRMVPFTSAHTWAYCDHFIRLRPDPEKSDFRYLAYFLNSAPVRRVLELGMVSSAGQHTVSQGTVLELDVPLLPVGRQREIVAEIEKQFSRLDEAVANLHRVKANLKRFTSSVLAEAVAGRLVATGADIAGGGSEIENAAEAVRRILVARGERSNGRRKLREPIPPSGELDDLPRGWCWTTVDQLAEVGTGATPNRSKAAYYEDGNVPWVTSSVVNSPYVDEASEFVTSTALDQTNLTLYPPGTLLVAMYGEGKTRGKCSELRIAAATNQALAALQVDAAFRPYLKLFLEHNYEATRMVATGGVQPNLNLGLVRAIKVPLPPIAEQHRIVAEVDRRLSIVREVEAEVDANLQRAQALRQAVLARAFFAR
jgi:type I restriction enzyme, S subunit